MIVAFKFIVPCNYRHLSFNALEYNTMLFSIYPNCYNIITPMLKITKIDTLNDECLLLTIFRRNAILIYWLMVVASIFKVSCNHRHWLKFIFSGNLIYKPFFIIYITCYNPMSYIITICK